MKGKKNKKTNDRNKNAGLIVGSAFLGAFVSRYVDKIMDWEFPADIIGIIITGTILFFVIKKIWNNWLN